MYIEKDRLREEIKIYNSKRVKGHIYLCNKCNKEIWLVPSKMGLSKCLCYKCSRKQLKELQTTGTKDCSICLKNLDISKFTLNHNKRTIINSCTKCNNLSKYGINSIQYDEMLDKQNGVCAICNNSDTISLAVDHNHETNQIRGLLCGKCNKALGLFNDDSTLLTNAIDYLNKLEAL